MPDHISSPSKQAQYDLAIAQATVVLGLRDDVLDVRPGFRVKDGVVTKDLAVVVAVRSKMPLEMLASQGITPLPTEIAGFPIDVANAAVFDLLPSAKAAAGKPPRGHNYKPRKAARFKLDRFKERMRATIHLGPDAGWPVLKAFLARTADSLTVGMFEYTAPHVVRAGVEASRALSRMTMTIQKGEDIGDGTKAADIPDEETVSLLEEALGEKFEHAWASLRFLNGIQYVNPEGIFDSSYHIKVAVRDGAETWLSSGSWQSSNQPPYDPIKDGDQPKSLLNAYNREWHVVIENRRLSKLFEEHLRQDRIDALAAPMPKEALRQASVEVFIPDPELTLAAARPAVPIRYFKPLELDREVDIQPILSPDNYVERVLEILEAAQGSIYFQNQSLRIRPTRPPGYERLLRTLLDKHRAGLDVRIIFRPFQDVRSDLEAIQQYGFDLDIVRLDEKCHTKGIVIDESVALLGSHNWTNAGTSYNRDASLIFFDKEVATYLQSVFLYDWSRARRARINENVAAPFLAAAPEEAAPPGMIKVRLSELDLA